MDKRTLNWSREARKESVSMFVIGKLHIKAKIEFNKDNYIDNRIVRRLI